MVSEQTKSKWSVTELLDHSGNYHIWKSPRGTLQGKDHQQVYSPLFGYQPQSFANGENLDVRYPYEIGERNLHPRKEPSSW